MNFRRWHGLDTRRTMTITGNQNSLGCQKTPAEKKAIEIGLTRKQLLYSGKENERAQKGAKGGESA
jgi:hypothetical protein